MDFFRVCTLIDFVTAIMIYFIFFLPKWNHNLYECLVKSLLYSYGYCVLCVTLIIPIIIPIPFVNIDLSHIHANLVPFIDYFNENGDFIRQIVLNILMLVPFGIMFPFIYHKDLKSTVFSGFMLSCSIEIVQLFSARQLSSCDITDVITNTFGVWIGYIFYRLFGKQVKQALQFLSHKKMKTFTVRKTWKRVIVIFIIVQLFIRSIIVYVL